MSEEEIDIINDILRVLEKSDFIENQSDITNKISKLEEILTHLTTLKENGIDLKTIEFEKCSICLENLNESNIRFLWCFCKFHKKCIDSWLKKHDTCPICRTTKEDLNKKEKKLLSKNIKKNLKIIY